MHAWGNGQMAGGLPDVAASWRVLTDGIGSGELTVGFGSWRGCGARGFRFGHLPFGLAASQRGGCCR